MTVTRHHTALTVPLLALLLAAPAVAQQIPITDKFCVSRGAPFLQRLERAGSG